MIFLAFSPQGIKGDRGPAGSPGDKGDKVYLSLMTHEPHAYLSLPLLSFLFKKRFIEIFLTEKMTLLDFNHFPPYKQGHPGPPGHPGTPGSMGAPVSHYFGTICLFNEL